MPSRLDAMFAAYFATHIPITLLVDVVPLLPEHAIPRPLRALNAFLTGAVGDPFMVVGPQPGLVWFRSLLAAELALQLPFFFYAVWALWTACPRRHLPLLVYGTHVATTMVPILASLLFGSIGRSAAERARLAAMYLPYLLIPVSMAVVSYGRCARALAARRSKAD
ncbi:Transmembrane protein 97 [Coemansia javaensis]|uniref:Efficient mitochondria targeting-associated protein 19 n=1 Tax=Coemansia javaensis TaxID=2761396 RepID=A0A9W8HM29_9FUNG|nr:Transmembrane protein 97 [Coemansia javaensis]